MFFCRLIKIPFVFRGFSFFGFFFILVGFFVGWIIKGRLLQDISILHDVQHLSDYSVAYRFEFLILRERNTLCFFVSIGTEYFISLFIPQLVQFLDSLVGRKFHNNSIHKVFYLRGKISVNLLALVLSKFLGQLHEHRFNRLVFVDAVIDFGYDFGEFFCTCVA